MRLSKLASAGALLFAVAFGAGRCSLGGSGDGPDDSERIPRPVATKTVMVEETKTVTKERTPESCLKALDDLDRIVKASSGLADVGNPQLDVMSSAHEAIAGKDYQRLVKLQEDQMKLNDKTVDHVKTLELDLLPQMHKYAKQCRSAK